MSSPKTEEEKVVASSLQKRHWDRCRLWAEALGVHHCAINDHWSCCFPEEPFVGLPLEIIPEDVEEKSAKFMPCKRERELEWGRRQRELEEADHHHRQRRRREVSLVVPIYAEVREHYEDDEIYEDDGAPDLPARIKIMFWAIRKVGGVENAKDALDRAIRSLEDE